MKIVLLSADSIGTRSMATFIETSDTKILIDPGVALGPRRYGLPPHPLEIERLRKDWLRIKKKAKEAEILIITHYHYDHFNPNELEVFRGKIIFIKDPEHNINLSQRKRARVFLDGIRDLTETICIADGNSFKTGSTTIVFSRAVPHGTNTRLGFVVEVFVKDNKSSFLFSSDIEGPSLEGQVSFMEENSADTIYIDGPMTYMLGQRYSSSSLDKSIENIIRIMKRGYTRDIILDHHLTRDKAWRYKLRDIFGYAETYSVKLCSGAEFMKMEETMLEARRKELYADG